MQSAQFQLHAEIEQRHWWFVARRTIIRRLVNEILPPATNSGILDVGCGTGANIAELAKNHHCIGIDTSPQAIELAKNRFPHVRFICGAAPADVIDFLPDIGLILLMDVLEHVADDYELLANLVAAAHSGTYFLITVPADRKLWSGHDEAFGHYRRYEVEEFERLWRDLPLERMFVSHFNSRLYPLVKMARWVNRRRGKTRGAAGTDFHLPSAWVNHTLEKSFAGESHRLIQMLRNRGKAYRAGVSLIALLRKTKQCATADNLQPILSVTDCGH